MWLAKRVWFLIYQVKYFRCCCCCCCVRYCNCRFSMKIQRVYIVSACARQCFPICFTFLQRDNNRLMERWQNAFAFIRHFHLEKSPWKAFADKRWSWWEEHLFVFDIQVDQPDSFKPLVASYCGRGNTSCMPPSRCSQLMDRLAEYILAKTSRR